MSEDSTISQLGGLALGNLLSEYGLDDQARQHLGINNNSNSGFDSNDIYNEKYMDDEDQFRGMQQDDQDQDDDEEEEEEQDQYGSRMGNGMDRYLKQGMAAISNSNQSTSYPNGGGGGGILLPGGIRIKQEDQDDDEEEEDERMSQRSIHQEQQKPRTVEEVWQGFERGKTLDFVKLYWPESMARPLKKRKLGIMNNLQPQITSSKAPVPPSTREDARSTSTSISQPKPNHLRQAAGSLLPDPTSRRARFGFESDEEMEIIGSGSGSGRKGNPNLELEEWEDKIIWGIDRDSMYAHLNRPKVQIDRLSNSALESGDFLESIIWDKDSDYKDFSQLILDMNDPGMMLEVRNEGDGDEDRNSSLISSAAPINDQNRSTRTLDPFNLSGDHHYEVTKDHRQRVRQTLGNLEIQHSWPAQKLQLPFFKPRLTKAEARSFHRPAMQFPSNLPLHFSRVEKSGSGKNKKDGRKASKNADEAFRSVRDLTLKDTGSFVLYEFSEEYPPILSKIGMGSLIVNYYRKKDPKDEHIPKSDLGEPFVLDVNDESPFMKFGFVDPGQTQTTMYTNLTRAPLFKHKPNHTDYLLIRSTTKNSVRYYLREVKNTFAVGQTYPTTAIPGPHARLVTNAIKNRLYMIVHRLIKGSKGERIKIHRIMRYFADQSELQMRSRLKEFMEYRRLSGDPDQGFWKMKPGAHIPDLAQLRTLLPPEHLCLSEAMQAGQRRLLDAGYSRTAEGADEEGDEVNGNLDIEQLLAPWIATKNFIHASQGKAMLKLHGDGDPTGMGEGFSFLRVSMKETFLRAGETLRDREAAEEATLKSSGHRYNTSEQQNIYRSEIDRIWKAQASSLSNPVPPEYTIEDERRAERERQQQQEQASRQRSVSRAPSVSGRDKSPGARSNADGDSEKESGKVLKIKRLINGKWRSELVRDPGVIASYVRHRQRLQAAQGAAEDLVPTGDATMDALAKERLAHEIAAATRNQERREQRRRQKAAAEGKPVGEKGMKSETKRKCGRCKQVGHMSTNTSCPLYNPETVRQQKQQAQQQAAAASSSSTPTSAQPTPVPSRPSISMGGGFFGAGPMQSPITPMSAGPMPPFTNMGPPQPPTPSASSPPANATSPPAQNQASKLKIKLKPSTNQ